MKKLFKLLLTILFGLGLGYVIWLLVPSKKEKEAIDELLQEEA